MGFLRLRRINPEELGPLLLLGVPPDTAPVADPPRAEESAWLSYEVTYREGVKLRLLA
jgi:hypothetical protein